jgi:dienelactone hydrolase
LFAHSILSTDKHLLENPNAMKINYWSKIILSRSILTVLILPVFTAVAQDSTPAAIAVSHPSLPPIPEPLSVPKPGPTNDAPYAPQAILPGGIVVPIYPPDSPYLNKDRVREAEIYSMSRGMPGRIEYIVNIHNPSIEVHLSEPFDNTGTAIILAAGGGHQTLNVGPEAAAPAAFFNNYGINSVILRNRLRKDGYNPQTDEVNDTLQAIRLVRAHAKDWHIDPNKIGIMGFSAGAELAATAGIKYGEFDAKNNDPGDPLAGISSRPDFVGLVYPGPTPFTRDTNGSVVIPKDMPPSFIVCAGSGDQNHATWSDAWFAAMLKKSVPNLEMHIYGKGSHAGGLNDRGNSPFGTWQFRFIDWFRDLGFLNKPGVETQAAKDVENYVNQPPRTGGGRSQGGGNR